MPELPEAERARLTLESQLGKRVVAVDDSDVRLPPAPAGRDRVGATESAPRGGLDVAGQAPPVVVFRAPSPSAIGPMHTADTTTSLNDLAIASQVAVQVAAGDHVGERELITWRGAAVSQRLVRGDGRGEVRRQYQPAEA